MADNKLSLIVSFIGNDKLSGALRNIIGLGKSGDQALKGLGRKAGRLRGAMKDVERELASATGNVTPLIDRQRDLAAELDRVNARIAEQRRLNERSARTAAIAGRGRELRSAGAENVVGGVAMAAPLVLAAKSAMDFSSGMVDIAQKANLTAAQTDAMAQGILRAADAAHQMPEAMRSGVDALSGFGIDPRDAIKMIGPIGQLGTAMKVDIADGAAAASANLQNLKVGLSDTGKALDIMAAGGNVGAFEVKDMARYFPSLTAQAQALGQSGLGAVADLTAALEIARRGAGTSEEAATNVANLLAKVNSPTVQNAFKKNFGVDLPAALKAAYAKGKTPMEALAEITQKATGGDLSKLGLVVEDMQAQSALRTLILNMEDYRKIRSDLGKSSGTVEAAFRQREAQDASIAWESFKGTASSLAITLGATLLPAVSQVLGQIGAGVSAVSRWAQANPELAKGIMTLVTGFIAGKIALGALQYGFGSILSTIAGVRNAFAMVQTAFAVVGPVIAAIGLWPIVIGAALAAMAYLVYTNWDRIKGWFTAGWQAIQTLLGAAPGWLKSLGGMMMEGLLAMLDPSRLVVRLLQVARAGVTAFKNYFGIKSPSRLMMEMGGHIATGLGHGIDGSAARPMRAMDRMAARVAGAGALSLASPSFAPAGGASRTGAGGAQAAAAAAPITIHIHQQPGESAEALADRVMRLLERRDDRRASYADDF
ncbi:phage tail tape measure protein [Novosphingobium sp.]|uniref:phage tail tape measure protein n=1 Tax=Novosphingobium sp. TaxID=1874826 RepID=UPI002FDD49DB